MKKIFIYSIAILAALAAASCSMENFSEQPVSEAVNAIELGVRCSASPVARTIMGNDTYNENTIHHIDYYIYNVDPGSYTATPSLLEGRITYSPGIQPIDETLAAANARRIILDDYAASFTANQGWIFVIANLPGDAPAAHKSLSELKAITLDATFCQGCENNLEGFIKRDNQFVMASDVQLFTLTEHIATSVITPLKRIVSKIQVNLNIVDELTEVISEQNIKEWTSQYDKVQVYLLDGIRHGVLDGTPISYEDAGALSSWFFTSPRYAMYSDGTTPGTAGGTVNSELIGPLETKPFGDYQLIQHEDPPGTLWWLDENEEPTTVNTGRPYMVWANVMSERNFWPVQSVPFYSYPLKWNAADAHAPFIKIILPWLADGDANPTEFYYKLALPKFEYGIGDEAFELRSNYCYVINLDITVLGSTADEIPVDVFGNYYVVGWDATPTGMGGSVDSGRYLDVPKSQYDMYGNVLEIPVRSSHTLEVIEVYSEYPNYQTQTPTTGHLTQSSSPSSVTGNNFYIAAQGRNSVILMHTPETNLNNMQPRDLAPITYTFRVRQQGAGGLTSQLVTVTQYPSLYIQNEESARRGGVVSTGFPYYNYYQPGYVYVDNQNAQSSGWRYVLRGLDTDQNGNYLSGQNNNPNMYVITTSVIAQGLSYILGDPRSGTVNNLGYGFSNAPAKYGTSPRTLEYYYPTDAGTLTENMIAPSFRIASSFGQVMAASSQNQRYRCASYQESGYPAGRWRFPTKAELEYITTLSAKGLIPSLFNLYSNNNSLYWSAHGAMGVNADGTVSEHTTNSAYVRCVYDDWYWKNADGTPDKVANDTFTWGDRQR
ncbi:MAG: hypothetical protein GX125_01260 [Bacteroidales bacterium]|jgi:hypothetical protein|nr:hypothetical protein [Bacteroidota bacterium]NLN98888.1 hypothetical protein [Bacteroidales bacterium]